MNCAFCGCRMIEWDKSRIPGYGVDYTCHSCCVSYTEKNITHYTHVGGIWKFIPEGCLMIVELEYSSEEIE